MSAGRESSALSGKEVSITGRLASMSREEARQLILDAGGAVASIPGRGTALLMVGQGGPPLGEDGQLTRPLREAQRLRDQGVDLEIVSEVEFLSRMGLDENGQEGLRRLYTTAQLSRILGVPVGEIRSWVRHGLIQPVKVTRRLRYFDFPQVATAKALSQLTKAGVTPARIRQSLGQLEAWLPAQDRTLTQLEALEQGPPTVVVRTSEGRLAETTGQLRLDFSAEPDEPAAALPALGDRADRAHSGPRHGVLTEQEWFEVGVEAEDAGRAEEAQAAYRHAIELGGEEAEIRFNLGNVLYASGGSQDEAIACFQQAVAIDPDYVEAWNNLGNVLAEIGRLGEALRAYQRALEIEPDYADAHYNLAETWAAHGDLVEARRHWAAYLRYDPKSSWAEVVRLRLERSEREPLGGVRS